MKRIKKHKTELRFVLQILVLTALSLVATLLV